MLKGDINSEVVYLILEGISRFSLLTQNKATLDKDQLNRLRKMKYQEDKQNGDFVVKIDNLIIEDKSSNNDEIKTETV